MDIDTSVPLLRLSGVSKSYGGVQALKDVSLDVHAGQVHALLGENGAGKSTLMGVASGTTVPDTGRIEIAGEHIAALTPLLATSLGIAIVHQHPAVLPDMTVAENIRIAIPAAILGAAEDARAWMRELLQRVGADFGLADRVDSLTIAQKQLLEVAKAIALEPRVLILDEPTAPLGADQVGLLFDQVRLAAARGTAVVYITHRFAELREVADHVTVLRDGQVRGTSAVGELSDADMLRLIVGRGLSSTFPPKGEGLDSAPVVLTVRGLSGAGFHDVDLSARRGEVVGLAGVVGNGQSQFLRALGGRSHATGEVELGGRTYSGGRLAARAAYMPADRLRDGLFRTMSVRENTVINALSALGRRGIVDPGRERDAVQAEVDRLAVRTATIEAPVTSLSGGNQQKVVMARALLAAPDMLLADEPTQGVDIGARAEIYRILREVAATGVPVVMVSSDAKELEGVCDRVLVFSRGQVVEELTGADVTEERITTSFVRATAHRKDDPAGRRATTGSRGSATGRLAKMLKGDYAPSLVLASVIILLGLFTYEQNARYLAPFNVTSVLTLLTALAFISMGQTIVIMTGGIDLSVGPLAGLLVVVASFFVNDHKSGLVMAAALALMLVVALTTGLLNGLLVRFGGFTAVAATLTTYIAIQGISLLLRPFQGGYINADVSALITKQVGVVPVAFLVACVLGAGLEVVLRVTRAGRGLRAVGSDEESARRLGVKVDRAHVLAYVACSGLTFLGAVMLMAQIGVGDPAQGVGYTLTSITAVVLGGASLLGGRGSFVGTLLGAALIQQILNATTFLDLSQAWQYFFQGFLILVAAGVYTKARHGSRRTVLG
ncbi:ATP-binding cassette domain-containing protein [Actinomadura scrupuli]|uniref:ATP-binding cassette domain-containing protein n=1 Tax=Actinomadura scrupuli TaxID=559629 RepID=UPI003D95400A